MSDPKKDESMDRHPWRKDEGENLTTDPGIQKEMIINQIANILRKSKKKGSSIEQIENE